VLLHVSKSDLHFHRNYFNKYQSRRSFPEVWTIHEQKKNNCSNYVRMRLLSREIRPRNIHSSACMRSRLHVPASFRSAAYTHTHTHHTHIGKLRSFETNVTRDFAFPYFYVTLLDPEPLCSPTPCNFTGWFWPLPCPSFINGHSRRSKHRIVSAQFANSATRTDRVEDALPRYRCEWFTIRIIFIILIISVLPMFIVWFCDRQWF